MNDREYAELKDTIKSLTMIDIDDHNSQKMRRRLRSFVATQGIPAPSYCKMIERDKVALGRLKDFITLNVPEFFGDKPQVDQLRTVILPLLLKHSPRLNIWSAGCCYGAEPYSVAIILDELSPVGGHRILATDIDDELLARARQGGPYLASDFRNVDKAILSKYFTPVGRGYRIIDRIRSSVEFRQHNLLAWSFECGFDLIICRNVVTHFSDESKERLARAFHYVLNEGGFLLIGATEALPTACSIGFQRFGLSFYQKGPVRGLEPVASGDGAVSEVPGEE